MNGNFAAEKGTLRDFAAEEEIPLHSTGGRPVEEMYSVCEISAE